MGMHDTQAQTFSGWHQQSMLCAGERRLNRYIPVDMDSCRSKAAARPTDTLNWRLVKLVLIKACKQCMH